VILSEDHLSCSSGPFYQSCSLTIWPNAPSRILTHTEQTLPKGYSKSQHPHKDCPMCRAINDRSNITVIFQLFSLFTVFVCFRVADVNMTYSRGSSTCHPAEMLCYVAALTQQDIKKVRADLSDFGIINQFSTVVME